MDPFDDILPVAPAARARAGGRFIPKAKSKQLPQKQVPALEHATSFKDGKNEYVASSSTSTDTEGISQNASSHHPPLEHPNMEHATNSESGKSQKVCVNGDTAALVDPLHSTIYASEVDTDWDFMNFPKSTHKAGPVGFDVGPDANFIPETHNGARQPVQSANAVENVLSNVAVPSSTCSNIGRMEEPHKNGEGSFLDGNKHSELTDDSLQAGPDVGLKSASDHKVATLESDIHSNFNFGREQQVESVNFELDPFSDILPEPGARNARKFQPKIKSRPRLGTAPATASPNVVMEKTVEMPTSCTNKVQSFHSGSDDIGRPNQSTNLPLATSEILRTTDLSNKFDYLSSSISFSEDNKGLGTVDSLNAMLSDVAESVQNGARDWPSSFSKSGGESADIFSGLESLDEFLTQTATDTGQVRRCPEYNTTQDSLTFNEATVLNEDDTRTNNRSETEEVINLNPPCPVDDGIDCPSMKSGANPTSEIPEPEELTNASDSPTLADFLHANLTGGKEDANEREKDGKMSSCLRKHKISSIAGHEDKVDKPSRQLRKRAASKPVNNTVNDDVQDDDDLDPPYDSNMDELEQNDDEFGVDNSSKKKRASTSSKKSGGKSGKTSQKHKRAKKDSEISNEGTPKKFSHSTRRRKRLDKALLEIPEDELDPKTLPLKDIILLAEYRERLAKKEATTSKTSSANRSRGRDSLHETGVNNEEQNLGLEDREDPGDDEASGSIPSAPTLFNYQSFMDKEPRGKWSKQDTELFYEAVRQFGTDFSMIQQLFPGRTRHQVKLKYKKEERQHPLQLYDAVNNRVKDLSHFKLVIERLQQASTKAEQDPITGASDVRTVDEVEELTPGTNEEVATSEQDANNAKDQEEVATTEQDANVKDQEDSAALSPEQSDDSDDDFQRWSQYKSDY